MLIRLSEHPDTPCPTVVYIDVTIWRPTPDRLKLRYYVWGDIEIIAIPSATGSHRRAEGLWKHTCFEAFIASDDGGYYEINLSPSGEWAAYRFDGYRSGMRSEDRLALVDMTCASDGDYLQVDATIDMGGLPSAEFSGEVRLGLSAVVEVVDEEGRYVAYFALAQPPGKPDFHHPDAFAGFLPPVEHP